MSVPHVSSIDKSVEHANIWVKDVAAELGNDDRVYAHRVLAAFLHVLRDRLTVEEGAQLSAQLPELIRGTFYEGWRPSEVPKSYRHASEFLELIARDASLHGTTEASVAADAAMRVLARHVSAGEIEDVLSVLPSEIRELLRAAC
jgi:uncharacterized protein (DUF2267 family)